MRCLVLFGLALLSGSCSESGDAATRDAGLGTGGSAGGDSGGGASGAAGSGGVAGSGAASGSGGGAGDGGVTCPPDFMAADGEPCPVDGQVCGGPCTNPCEFCSTLTCQGGTWSWMEAFPAPCDGEAGATCTQDYDCLPSLRCCYPCGIPGCTNQCTAPEDGGGCPMYP